MLVNMKEVLEKAQQGGYAVGAFNIVNYLTAAAVIDEAQALQAPVILQTSQKTVIQIGAKRLACFVCPLARPQAFPWCCTWIMAAILNWPRNAWIRASLP